MIYIQHVLSSPCEVGGVVGAASLFIMTGSIVTSAVSPSGI